MPISSLHICDGQGKVVIARNYRGDIDQSVLDTFPRLIADCEENDNVKPLIRHKACSFFYIKHNSLYIVATARNNGNAAMIFSMLYKIVRVMTEYLEEVNEESVRDNFVFLYELLDEVIDFGYPQTTETRILQEYVMQERWGQRAAVQIPPAVTNSVSWRPTGLKYDKNEVLLDVIEYVNVLINCKGDVIRSDVTGVINLRVYLSGMPELRLGLNDKVALSLNEKEGKCVKLDDVKFHQCVRLSRFEADGTIAFIPPDGHFELMSYRLETVLKPLVQVQCDVEHHERSRVLYRVRARSNFKKRSTANAVEILIPTPSDADSPNVKTSSGSVLYEPARGGFVWQIKSLPGGKELTMTAELRLPSVAPETAESRRPIAVKFEIPYFTMSGLQIRYLKIAEKTGYSALPWVRYITKNGDYLIRL